MTRRQVHARSLGLAFAGLGALGSLALSRVPATGPAGSFATAAAVGCGAAAAGGDGGNQDPAGLPIVIGASVSLTGALAGNARAETSGLLAAAAQINALGGILGRTVQVNAQDDTSLPQGATSVVMGLFNTTQATALIGPTGSAQVLAIEPYIMSNGFLDTSATATSAQLTQGYGPKTGIFFRTVPSDAYQAVAVALFAQQGPGGDPGKGGCETMDVVHNNDAYGNPLSQAIEAYFMAHGGTVPPHGDFPVPENALSSYDSQITQLFKDLPDCLVLAVYPPVAAQFMEDLSMSLTSVAPKGWSPTFFVIGTDGTYDPSLLTDGLSNPADPTSQSFVNGTSGPPMYGTVAYTNNHDRPQYNELVTLYDAEVGLQPGQTDLDPYTSNVYDAIVLELLAMQAAGTTHARPVQQAMFNVSRGKSCGATTYGPADLPAALAALQKGADINYQGASGNVDFDDYGDVIADFLVWQVQPSSKAPAGSAFVNHSVIASAALQTALSVDAGGCQ